MLQIRYPIWKTRSIGIAEERIGTKDTDIEITYIKKDGTRLYPHIYTITRDRILTYPVQIVRGIRLRIIPIADLSIKEFREAVCV